MDKHVEEQVEGGPDGAGLMDAGGAGPGREGSHQGVSQTREVVEHGAVNDVGQGVSDGI